MAHIIRIASSLNHDDGTTTVMNEPEPLDHRPRRGGGGGRAPRRSSRGVGVVVVRRRRRRERELEEVRADHDAP